MKMYFKDYHEDGTAYLCVVENPKANLANAKNKFPVYLSMLRPHSELPCTELRTRFPLEMTSLLRANSPTSSLYTLQSVLPENEVAAAEFPILGRKIIKDDAQWGSTQMRILGDFVHVPLYWEWTEDIIARFSTELHRCQVFDAVYASLYTYDRDPNVMRAFYESWCPQTNTLHTIAGEWSISLWDLFKLGGLPISGHIYDETVPNTSALEAQEEDGTRLISRACQHLFVAYAFLKNKEEFKHGVPAKQWAQFWCKRAGVYVKPHHRRNGVRNRPKKTYNPTGEIKDKPCDWTQEERDLFFQIGAVDEKEWKTTFIAAHFSGWICGYLLPKHNDRLIRPRTFEIAVRMASGSIFSLAVPVLANIYHGLNQTVKSSKPAYPSSKDSTCFFPAHYVFAWLAHHLDTHHSLSNIPKGPLMVAYSGYQGAKYFDALEARKLIHESSSFKPCNLMLSRNKRMNVFDNTQLDSDTFNYVISLRTAFLPLRCKDSFVLEPYCPTRFSRQFGYCQVIPRTLKPDSHGEFVTRAVALLYLRLLLFEGSHSKITLPSYSGNWTGLLTKSFKNWWSKLTVVDLRDKVDILIANVESKQTDKDLEPDENDNEPSFEDIGENLVMGTTPSKEACASRGSKRTFPGCSSDEVSEVNFKHNRKKKAKVHDDFLEGVPSFSDAPACDAWEGVNIDLEKEVPDLIVDPASDVANLRPTHGKGKPTPPSNQLYKDFGLSTSSEEHSAEETHSLKNDQVVESRSNPSSSTGKPVTSADIVDDITDGAVKALKQGFLECLQKTLPDRVAEMHIEAKKIYRNILRLGGDPTALRTTVDAYVKDVKDFLELKKIVDEAGVHGISQVEENLTSAKIVLEDALKAETNSTQRISELELLLTSLKERQQQSLQVVSDAKSKVDLLQHEFENFHSNQTKLEMAQTAMLEKKERLYSK